MITQISPHPLSESLFADPLATLRDAVESQLSNEVLLWSIEEGFAEPMVGIALTIEDEIRRRFKQP